MDLQAKQQIIDLTIHIDLSYHFKIVTQEQLQILYKCIFKAIWSLMTCPTTL